MPVPRRDATLNRRFDIRQVRQPVFASALAENDAARNGTGPSAIDLREFIGNAQRLCICYGRRIVAGHAGVGLSRLRWCVAVACRWLRNVGLPVALVHVRLLLLRIPIPLLRVLLLLLRIRLLPVVRFIGLLGATRRGLLACRSTFRLRCRRAGIRAGLRLLSVRLRFARSGRHGPRRTDRRVLRRIRRVVRLLTLLILSRIRLLLIGLLLILLLILRRIRLLILRLIRLLISLRLILSLPLRLILTLILPLILSRVLSRRLPRIRLQRRRRAAGRA